MNYYLVDAQFGHVGRNKYIVKTIATLAENAKEAAKKVRWMPRVKHDRKDAIIDVKKASYDEYIIIKNDNDNDQYFKVRNVQEQKRLCGGLYDQAITYKKEEKRKRNKDTINFKLKRYKEIIKDMYLEDEN